MKSEDASTYYQRGLAKYHMGNYGDALKDYKKAVELDPSNVNVEFERAILEGLNR